MTYPAHVLEFDRGRWEAYDIWTRLLKDNIIFLGSEINDHVANMIAAQMLYLEASDPDKEISLYINSPGGRALYASDEFHKHGLELSFLPPYAGPPWSILHRVLTEDSSKVSREILNQL